MSTQGASMFTNLTENNYEEQLTKTLYLRPPVPAEFNVLVIAEQKQLNYNYMRIIVSRLTV